jgi:hypothetical protein
MPINTPACTIITIAQHNENFSYCNKTNDGYRTIFYSPQGFNGRLREYLTLSGISQHLDCLIERDEKRGGRYIRIRKKWIFEVNLKERGMCIPALDLRFPKQKGKNADANEHDDYLKKYRAPFHRRSLNSSTHLELRFSGSPKQLRIKATHQVRKLSIRRLSIDLFFSVIQFN